MKRRILFVGGPQHGRIHFITSVAIYAMQFPIAEAVHTYEPTGIRVLGWEIWALSSPDAWTERQERETPLHQQRTEIEATE